MKYLNLAIKKHNHAQAMYELGTCYYTGLEGVLEENEVSPSSFERAAHADHVAAKYMCADMLLEEVESQWILYALSLFCMLQQGDRLQVF